MNEQVTTEVGFLTASLVAEGAFECALLMVNVTDVPRQAGILFEGHFALVAGEQFLVGVCCLEVLLEEAGIAESLSTPSADARSPQMNPVHVHLQTTQRSKDALAAISFATESVLPIVTSFEVVVQEFLSGECDVTFGTSKHWTSRVGL